MAFAKIQTSFGAGELSPSLFARVDLEKYASGAALMRNFFTDYRGGAATRAGTEYVASVDGSAGQPRVIPFVPSTTSTYICVFGNLYIQFFSNGAYIGGADLVSPYAAADIPLIKFVQSADVLTLTHPLYPVYNLTQTGPTSFALTQDVIGAVVAAPTSMTAAHYGGANAVTFTCGFVVTAVSADGKEESVACFPAFTNFGNYPTDPNAAFGANLAWAPSTSLVSFYKIYRTALSEYQHPVNTVYGYVGQSVATTYFDSNVFTNAADFSQTPPDFQDPFSPGQIASVVVASGGSGYTGDVIPLIFTGGGGSGAAGYATIDESTGTVVGIVLTNFGHNYTTAPGVTDSHGFAAYTATLGQLTGTYPAVPTYFQQRRTFGGTINFPESFVCSQPGEYNNFNTSAITNAADSITVSLSGRQNNSIKGMIPMSTGLVIFTTGGAFLVSGGNQQAAITPSDVVAYPQASSGANDLPPLQINYDILYCQNRGATVRDLAFNFYVQNYTGTDRSVLASHLFLGYTLNEWTYAEEPFRQILVVRNDGQLLCLTYVPEQEVFAWAHYDTFGQFVSVASVPEGQTNAVYVIVKRNVGGAWVYFLERFDTRLFAQVQDAWCVDAGLALAQTYPGANITLSAATGNITITASAAVFSAGSVGKVIWAGAVGQTPGGQATVTAYTDAHHVTAQVNIPFPVVGNEFNSVPVPYAAGEWTLDAPVSSVSGLDYLDGLTVYGLADGVPLPPTVVVAGTVALPQPATKVIIGLPYQCQLQTLKLDLGQPTVQGKRKTIPAGTWRLLNALGLKVGPDFATLVPIKDTFPPYSVPNPLFTGDIRTVVQSVWDTEGQICFQQDNPLPATVLGLIPEVLVGDTQK